MQAVRVSADLFDDAGRLVAERHQQRFHELVTGFFQSMGQSMDEGGTQGVGGGAFGDAGGTDSSSDGPLNAAGVQVMALDRAGAGIYREILVS